MNCLTLKESAILNNNGRGVRLSKISGCLAKKFRRMPKLPSLAFQRFNVPTICWVARTPTCFQLAPNHVVERPIFAGLNTPPTENEAYSPKRTETTRMHEP